MAVAGAIICESYECGVASSPASRDNSSMAKAKNRDFDDFVKRQQPLSEAERVDWNKRRDEWLANLNALNSKIEAFLKEYVDNGSISLDYKEHRIIEEKIGAYKSRMMIIRIGGGKSH